MRFVDRLRNWDVGSSRRLGLRFDDPSRSPDENIRRAQRSRRFWLRPPIVVDEADYLSQAEAQEMLGRTTLGLGNLIARGILQHCFVADGREGVTRLSVNEELDWQQNATRWRRFTRAVGGILHWV